MKHIYWPNYRKKNKKNKKNNDKDPRFKVVEHDRILKYMYFLQIVTIQIDVLQVYKIEDLNCDNIGMFCKKELQNANQLEFRIAKIINEEVDKLNI